LSSNFSTCSPDLQRCPDGRCDALERHQPQLCPQDCAPTAAAASSPSPVATDCDPRCRAIVVAMATALHPRMLAPHWLAVESPEGRGQEGGGARGAMATGGGANGGGGGANVGGGGANGGGGGGGGRFFERLHCGVAEAAMFEYKRPGWTFHAKGLWVTLPHHDAPSLSLVGSTNFGRRSAERDLEAQLCIATTSPSLRQQLRHEERCLLGWSSAVSAESLSAQTRGVRLWVRLLSPLLRHFF
ncbi:unnamed protein product, partial [Lampetra fluviatilis]